MFLVSYFLSWGSEGSLRSWHSLQENKKKCMVWIQTLYITVSFNCCVHVNAWICFSAHSYFVKEVKVVVCMYVIVASCPLSHLSSRGSLLTWRSWLTLGTLRDRNNRWWSDDKVKDRWGIKGHNYLVETFCITITGIATYYLLIVKRLHNKNGG